jgi:hypothetical protein
MNFFPNFFLFCQKILIIKKFKSLSNSNFKIKKFNLFLINLKVLFNLGLDKEFKKVLDFFVIFRDLNYLLYFLFFYFFY